MLLKLSPFAPCENLGADLQLRRVHVLSHSLGCSITAEALYLLYQDHVDTGNLGDIIFAAADISVDGFEGLGSHTVNLGVFFCICCISCCPASLAPCS